MSCPTSGAWRWFSKRCRTRRCRRGSRSGAGATRFVQRATIAVLQHERSLVREFNRSARCAASARWTARTSRRSTTTASRTSPEPRSTVPGSHNFSRLSLLESKEPWVDVMVRQLREQGRVAGLRRAPRRQGRGQSQGRPVARPARPPTPTGESVRRPASTGRPARVKSWFGYGLRADTKYETLVAFSVTRASRAETKELNGDKPFEETSLLRCKDFSVKARQRAAQGEVVGSVRPVACASREEKTTRTNPSSDRSSTTTSTREARCWS